MMKQPVVKVSAAVHSMFTESIAEFISGDLMPLSIVGSKHFRGMVNILIGDRYKCPGRRYFTENLLPKMKDDCTAQMKKEIESINGIGLTTDAWTSLATENYITYTAHYITKDCVMKSKVLSTHYSEERYTAENLAADLKQIELKWGLNKLIFNPTYVHDNATNVTKVPKLMEDPRLGIGCLAHTINLAANFATAIKPVQDILNKAGEVDTTFKRSTLAANILK